MLCFDNYTHFPILTELHVREPLHNILSRLQRPANNWFLIENRW